MSTATLPSSEEISTSSSILPLPEKSDFQPFFKSPAPTTRVSSMKNSSGAGGGASAAAEAGWLGLVGSRAGEDGTDATAEPVPEAGCEGLLCMELLTAERAAAAVDSMPLGDGATRGDGRP